MDRRIQKTREAILNAYLTLLMEKKTTHVTITEIARRANIDRKTFYLHYASVDDIVREFSKNKIQELLLLLDRNDFFDHPFDTDCLFSALAHLVERDMDFYRHIAAKADYDFFWEQLQDILFRTAKDVYANLSVLPPEQLDIYVRLFASGLISVYRRWLKGEISLPIEELSKVAGYAIYGGIQKMFPVLVNEASD